MLVRSSHKRRKGHWLDLGVREFGYRTSHLSSVIAPNALLVVSLDVRPSIPLLQNLVNSFTKISFEISESRNNVRLV